MKMNVLLVGAGGIGTTIIFYLSHMIKNKNVYINVVDFDEVEVHNFSRIPLPIHARGKKVDVIQKVFETQYVRIFSFDVKINDYNDIVELIDVIQPDVLVEVTDDPKVQQLVLQVNIPRIVAHYDGDSISLFFYPKGSREEVVFTSERPQGYVFPSFATPAITIAYIVSEIIMKMIEANKELGRIEVFGRVPIMS